MKHTDLKKLAGARLVNLYLSLREIELMKKLDHPNIIKMCVKPYRKYQKTRALTMFAVTRFSETPKTFTS